MQQAVKKIRARGDFEVTIISIQAAKSVTTDEDVLEVLIEKLGYRLDRKLPETDTWKNLAKVFTKDGWRSFSIRRRNSPPPRPPFANVDHSPQMSGLHF